MSDLESALRTMLHDRAGDITALPPHVVPEAVAGTAAPTGVVELAPSRHARRPLVPLLAAAAVAALIAGIGFAIAGSDDHRKPRPVTHPALPPVSRVSCATAIPAGWQDAATAATTNAGSDVSVIAAMPGGGAVVRYSNEPWAPNPPVQVGYLPPGSTSVTPLTHFVNPRLSRKGPYQSVSTVLDADSDGSEVVLSWATGHRSETVKVIEAIDVTTGTKSVITRAAEYPRDVELSQGYVLDGVVYWQVSKLAKGYHKDTLWSYDLASHRRVEVGKPGLYDLERSAAGVMWNLTNGPVDRPAALPAAVAKQVNPDNADAFVTDGSSYAWVTRSGNLGWWGPGANRVVYIRGLLSKPWRVSTPGVPMAVAGPLVQYQVPRSGDDRIVDVRTGATVASNGSLYGRDGQWVGDPSALGVSMQSGNVMRLPVSQLAELRC